MAVLTVGREIRRLVTGIVGRFVVTLVTGKASARGSGIGRCVTGKATEATMATGERKAALVVIEGCRYPGSC